MAERSKYVWVRADVWKMALKIARAVDAQSATWRDEAGHEHCYYCGENDDTADGWLTHKLSCALTLSGKMLAQVKAEASDR